MIAMIDVGLGNLQSVRGGFQRIGVPIVSTSDPADVAGARAVILPGVGAFGEGMERLKSHGMIEPILRHAREKKPLLGICLGMQFLADASEEHGLHDGLGLVPGRVVKLDPPIAGTRVPNIGWCEVKKTGPGVLFATIADKADFYFVHSYYFACADPARAAGLTEYGGQTYAAAVESGNIFGVQFHPEKSQDCGLELLHNFARHVEAA